MVDKVLMFRIKVPFSVVGHEKVLGTRGVVPITNEYWSSPYLTKSVLPWDHNERDVEVDHMGSKTETPQPSEGLSSVTSERSGVGKPPQKS